MNIASILSNFLPPAQIITMTSKVLSINPDGCAQQRVEDSFKIEGKYFLFSFTDLVHVRPGGIMIPITTSFRSVSYVLKIVKELSTIKLVCFSMDN